MGRAFEFRKERKMKRWAAMSKIFARLNKDIILAIKEGGGIADPDTNARLRAVLQNCKAANMPKDNIERAIKKATDKDTSDYKEVTFEGYGPTASPSSSRRQLTTTTALWPMCDRISTVEVDNSAPQARWNSCSTVCAFSMCRIQALTSTT